MGREATANAGRVRTSGAYFMLDAEKLTREEHLMVGEINALERWSKAFGNMRLASKDPIERNFLAEISRALSNDAESIGMELAKQCQAKGFGRLVDHHQPPESNQ